MRECVSMVRESAFNPNTISTIHRHATRFIIRTREQYTTALRHNLHTLLEGVVAPRQFVREFFELTEAGNLRNDIRKKLVLSLLLSETIRPSVKFLMLENFQRLPEPVRLAIISAVLKADSTRHTDIIKEELTWIVQQERLDRDLQ